MECISTHILLTPKLEWRSWFKYEIIYSELDLIIPSYAIGYFPSLVKSILHSQDGQFIQGNISVH